LRDRVLIRRVEAKEKTPGGIIIPDTAKEKPIEGEVLAVGAGAPDETGRIIPAVKAGDRVLFGKWAGTGVLIEGEERAILKTRPRKPHRHQARHRDRWEWGGCSDEGREEEYGQ
jgi:chaperonin GroES